MNGPGTGKRIPTEHQPNADRTPTGIPIAAAATRLGVSTDAIRARIRRGTLEGVKHGGTWFVTLPDDAPVAPATPEQPDQTQPDTDRVESSSRLKRSDDALIDHLQGEIEYLRARLEDRDRQLDTAINQAAAERERADVLQREALHRLQALTSGPTDRQRGIHNAPGSPESIGSTAKGESVAGDAATPPASVWARLWRALRGDG